MNTKAEALFWAIMSLFSFGKIVRRTHRIKVCENAFQLEGRLQRGYHSLIPCGFRTEFFARKWARKIGWKLFEIDGIKWFSIPNQRMPDGFVFVLEREEVRKTNDKNRPRIPCGFRYGNLHYKPIPNYGGELV